MARALNSLCLGALLSATLMLGAGCESEAVAPAGASTVAGSGGGAGESMAPGTQGGEAGFAATGGGSGGSAAGGSGAGGSGAGGQGGQPCGPAPDVQPGAAATCVRDVRGSLVDEYGAPIAKRTVTLCGVVCFGGSTDETGAFVIPVNAQLPNDGYAVLAHGRPDRASVIARLPGALGEQVDLSEPLRMPLLPPAGVFLPADGAAAQTITAGAVSLRVAEGTTWELDPEDVAALEQGGQEGGPRPVAFARVLGASVPPFAKDSSLVFVLGPFDARPSRPLGVDLAIPPDALTAFSPGASVELITMDTALYTAGHTGGLARVLAQGHVSADGTRITTDEGEGIDALGWLAVR